MIETHDYVRVACISFTARNSQIFLYIKAEGWVEFKVAAIQPEMIGLPFSKYKGALN